MFTFIRNLIAAHKKTLKNNVGATMIEYALVIGAVVAIATVYFKTGAGDKGLIGNAIDAKLSSVVTNLQDTKAE